MARVALVKLFTGLNLAVSQLSAELRRAGHQSLIVYLKDYVAVPLSERHRYQATEYAGVNVYAKGTEWIWNCYDPITEQEYQHLFHVLREFGADVVGFSLTSAGMPIAADVTARLREELQVPVLWGGTGPTLQPERCIDVADAVCVNEGEEVIVEVARRVDRGEALEGIAGLWVRRNGAVHRSEPGPLIDLEKVAIPDFEPTHTVHIESNVLTRDVYPRNLGSQYAIMTSRGCPFSCSFCVESVLQDRFGKKGSLRRRSVDLVVEELVAAKARLGITSVMFYDDVFTTHRKWLEEFGPKYRDRVGLPFWCYTYPTTTRREDIRLLRDAGCVSMTMGIQSGSQRVLNDHFGRPAPLTRARDAARIVLEEGIQCFFDLITKVDFETEADLEATFELLTTLPPGVKSQGFGYMTRFPGYGYTKSVEESGQLRAVSDEAYRYWHRMYLLAIQPIPRALKLAIAKDPTYRARPELLEALLTSRLPVSFLEGNVKTSGLMLDASIAQATVPEEFASAFAQAGSAPDQRRLPLIA